MELYTMLNEKGQKINFQKELDKKLIEIKNLADGDNGDRPSLLLHACCGPCSSYVLEYLVQYFDITVFYYNPNIYPEEEYRRRFEELKNLYVKFPPAIQGKVKVVEKTYNPEDFYNAVGTRDEPALAVEPEKGERCRRCYEFRLKATYDYACENHFDYFCTTLSISPFKDADKLNVIGQQLDNGDRDNCTDNGPSTSSGTTDNCPAKRSLSLSKGPQWLISDFKKNNGFKRSLEISEEYGLYRQDYCGCIYSKQNKKTD